MDETNPSNGGEGAGSFDISAALEGLLNRQAEPDGGTPSAASAVPGDGAVQVGSENAGQATPPEEQRFTLQVNGEERQVPLSELLAGYSKEQESRVKDSHVAEQSRQAQAVAQQAQQEQARYAQAIQAYSERLQAMEPSLPNRALIQTDPVAFLQQQQAYQEWRQQMQQVQTERQQLAEHVQMQQAEAQRLHLQKETAALTKAIPDFADPIKAKAMRANLSEFLAKVGYAEGEIAAAQDHRAIVLAHKAMLYDQIVAQQAKVGEKLNGLPPKAPPRPGNGQTPAADGRSRSMQSLKKSGSIEDAAGAFAAVLGS